MRKLFILIMVVMLSGVSCKTMPPIPIEPPGTSSCQNACDRLKMLSCPEGEDLPDGTTCTVFCIETQEKGHSLNPQCLKAIDTCEEIYTKCGQ